MTIKDFFNDSPWISWGLIALYAVECVAVVILIFKIFGNKKNCKK